jgi:hypothetical protein
MTDEQRRQDHDAPAVFDDVTAPPADPVREARERDATDPAEVRVDPDVLRDGGPTRGPGIRTTTGSSFGPGGPGRTTVSASLEPTDDDDDDDRTAPTTTGDATTGGMETPVGSTTSDATTAASSAGTFTDK